MSTITGDQMFEPNDRNVLDFLEKIIPYLATGALGFISFIVKGSLSTVNKLDERLDEHHERLVTIEANYVSKNDLEAIVKQLQNDLAHSFDRAHERIDKLYQQPKS